MGFIEILFLLTVAHVVCDYPLQGEFMSIAKNRNTDVGRSIWWMILPSHALIHAGGVYLVTHSLVLSLFEFSSHLAIDFLKCENRLTFAQDQGLHVAVKVVIAIAFIAGI